MNIPLNVRQALLENEAAICRNTIYILEARYTVSKRVGDDENVLKPIKDDLIKSQLRLDEYEKMLAELSDESRKNDPSNKKSD